AGDFPAPDFPPSPVPFSFASLCFLESFHHPFLASIIPLLPSFFHKKNKAHWFIVDFVSSL
ncbi:MAG: hypothetical protein IJL52_02475, partial [Clostridia bacterium]|nr:hypothetical protein [Clostridia bacterium]